MRRIAVINQKGGVGKTTSSVNLGACLAEQGRRTVLVDMDPQANLTLHLGLEAPSEEASTYSVLHGRTSFAEALRPTALPRLSAVPSNLDLSGAELELAGAIGRENLLRDALERWECEHRAEHGTAPAEYVIFDCPPSLGLLSINALAAAGEVLIAVQTEFMALMGMSKLVEVVQLMRRRLNPSLRISGILPCLYDSRLRLAREVLAEVRKYFPGEVFRQPVRANVKLAEAPSYGQTILEYAPESNGALDYRRVALEILAQEEGKAGFEDLPPPRSAAELAAPSPERSRAHAAAPPAEPAPSGEALREVVLRPADPSSPAAPATAPGGGLPSLPPEAYEIPRG